MASVNGITGLGSALSNVQLQTQIQTAVLSKQQDVVKELGDLALKLIESASIDPSVGRGLDVSI